MKNNWKVAFWICLFLLFGTGIFGLYTIVDQAVTISYMQEGWAETEADLETLNEIIGQTDQTKQEIEKALEDHRLREFMDFNSDTIGLERVILIFENDTLKSLEKQW